MHPTNLPDVHKPAPITSPTISSTGTIMNVLQPPPAIHNIQAPPVLPVPATAVDLLHADNYADAMALSGISESKVLL
jgi:hypothetical protein